ncbi:MAG: aminotransferase class III-fold pyridoxal phosphate-dependent enzyme, partial [Desulfurococcales archaeon]|nr:aminotransferase class III-fold pyridoxal phosphate-dependent enzyme [Desulfurococcales archaeon]
MCHRAENILRRELKVVGRAVHIRFYPAVIERGEGPYLYDVEGRRYLDFNASWAVANTGYGHPKIVEAVIEAYRKLTALSFTTFSNETVIELAEKLVEITPGKFEKKVVFGHSGSDANDCVFKLIPYYKRKPRIISFIGAYHGQTMGSYSLSGHKAQSRIVGLPNIVKVPFPYGYRCPFKGVEGQKECEEACLDFLENYVLKTIAPLDTVAGVVVEPIQSDGGDIVPTPYFLKELRR